MNARYVLSLIVISLGLSSCLFDSGSDDIVGEYKTTWIDLPETRNINKGEQVVPEYVSEICHNSRFIIAKQHPIKYETRVIVNTDTVNYYIIEISDNSFQDKPVYGPLDKNKFDSLRRKLKISHIRFDMHYPVD